MKIDFKVNIFKSFSFKDDVDCELSYHIESNRIPDIISGWEDAGYVVRMETPMYYEGGSLCAVT